jgi:hypothetical protein
MKGERLSRSRFEYRGSFGRMIVIPDTKRTR